uniref:Uncharacterized protein n=1 Tax=Amphimedon queenslandica TaxID=400682 RepID=A0A1X7VHK1_AMPQE
MFPVTLNHCKIEQPKSLDSPHLSGWQTIATLNFTHAAKLGRKDVVQYLVSNVPRDSLDLQNEEKAQTALHKAAWYGYRGICKILVDVRASSLRTDYQANTPYLKSIESEDPKLKEYLQRKEREEKIRYEIEEVEEVAV